MTRHLDREEYNIFNQGTTFMKFNTFQGLVG